MENIVKSSPNLTVNFTEDGISGVLSNIEYHAIGNIMTVSIVMTITPPVNNFIDRGVFSPRLVSIKF